mgnify:CR=1 FL=1
MHMEFYRCRNCGKEFTKEVASGLGYCPECGSTDIEFVDIWIEEEDEDE